jgi:phospholipid/cholesterol/gamma-HCH transport system substrate-binding protein
VRRDDAECQDWSGYVPIDAPEHGGAAVSGSGGAVYLFDSVAKKLRAFVTFDNAAGMTPGTPVSYRGVKVGRVVAITPEPQGVTLEIEISPANRLIPSNSTVETIQSGLVGETSINITPLQALPPSNVKIAHPLDPDCNPDIIICNGSKLQGQAQLDVNELIRATTRIANLLSDPQFTANINSVTKNASDALVAVSNLSTNVTGLSTDLRQLLQRGSVESTLTSVGAAATEIRSLIATNRTELVGTLTSFRQTSDQLRTTVQGLSPVVDQVRRGELIRNLDVLSANAVKASENLRDFSTNLNNPSSLLELQQLLDSARSVFQNVQKITSDVDELTGDPAFRTNIRDLVNGLRHLISSTEQLQQQAQVAQALDSLSATMNKASLNRSAKEAALTPSSSAESTAHSPASIKDEAAASPVAEPSASAPASVSRTESEVGYSSSRQP